MRNLILLGAVLFLAGCAPMKVSVFGASGKAFTAPSLCAALIECKKGGESSCYYDSVVLTNNDGSKEVFGCKEVKK